MGVLSALMSDPGTTLPFRLGPAMAALGRRADLVRRMPDGRVGPIAGIASLLWKSGHTHPVKNALGICGVPPGSPKLREREVRLLPKHLGDRGCCLLMTAELRVAGSKTSEHPVSGVRPVAICL